MRVTRAFGMALSALLSLASDSPAQALPHAVRADFLVVHKAERTLTLYWHGAKLKSYRVALGGRPVGAKAERGDQRTPEGLYSASVRQKETAFHAALVLSYPNDDDLARAKAAGVRPGGGIEIHGLRDGFEWLGSAHVLFDWTDGCIAVTNTEIDELVRAVPDGTPIEILP
jgi:murein L,D-transpeptidase YafK